jgi:Flp pilus assembly protein TadB
MKKITFVLMLVSALMLNFSAVNANETNPRVSKELTTEQRAELTRIMSRVDEIKAMDKSKLSKSERKDLRKELKEMKKKANAIGGGVYLSVGAIIIIILLLILIL